jgi:hypothetical protein
MIQVTDPRYMSIEHWTSLVGASLQPFGGVPLLATLKDWRHWANEVRQIPAISNFGVPEPSLYKNWVDWAHRLNAALLLL